MRAQILTRGLFESVRRGSVSAHPASSTEKWIRGATLRHTQSATQITAELGQHFGFQYRISGIDPKLRRVRLRRVLKHPVMQRPDGTSVRGSDYSLVLPVHSGVAIDITGYAFNEPYELVAGTWVFQLWQEDTLLLEERFESTKPATTP